MLFMYRMYIVQKRNLENINKPTVLHSTVQPHKIYEKKKTEFQKILPISMHVVLGAIYQHKPFQESLISYQTALQLRTEPNQFISSF